MLLWYAPGGHFRGITKGLAASILTTQPNTNIPQPQEDRVPSRSSYFLGENCLEHGAGEALHEKKSPTIWQGSFRSRLEPTSGEQA